MCWNLVHLKNYHFDEFEDFEFKELNFIVNEDEDDEKYLFYRTFIVDFTAVYLDKDIGIERDLTFDLKKWFITL